MKGLLYIIPIVLVCLSCSEPKKEIKESTLVVGDSLRCTAEDTIREHKNSKPIFVNDGYRFMYGDQVTDEVAFSGKRSIKLDPSHRFGMEVTIPNVKPNDAFKVSVMRKGSAGNIAMKCPTNDQEYFHFGGELVGEEVNGWQKMVFYTNVPPHIKGAKVKFYLQYFEKGVTFFDDFTIEKVSLLKYPEFDNEEAINLYIDEKSFEQLNSYRRIAFTNEVIPKKVKKYVNGYISYGKDTAKCKLRLKGEWLDHLVGDKWSFRIKVKNGSIAGSSKFSIHTPLARNFLNEYLAHKAFEDENILTSQYDFVPVKMNGRSLGLYAKEEYFDLNYAGRNNRKGIVLRWDEEGFWLAQVLGKKGVKNVFNHPMYQSSFVTSFSVDNMLDDLELKSFFKSGSKLLYDFRDDKIDVEEAFCIEQLAKYTVLVDLFGSFHGATWHNIRYFYNADSAKLEPILFDGYSDSYGSKFNWLNRGFIGDLRPEMYSKSYNDYQMTKIFNNKKFRERYVFYVEKYGSNEFIDRLLNKYDDKIEKYRVMISKEFTNYRYDKNLLKKRSKTLLRLLNNNRSKFESFSLPKREFRRSECNYPVIPNYSVQAFTQDFNDFQKKVKIRNNYCNDMLVYVNKDWVSITPYGGEEEVVVGIKEENFQMKVNGTSKIYNLELLPYMRP